MAYAPLAEMEERTYLPKHHGRSYEQIRGRHSDHPIDLWRCSPIVRFVGARL